MKKQYDFGGWATKNNIKCLDGRIICKDAFKHNNGETVPLVWNHSHNDPSDILGHALLENRNSGVYAYCTFNNTENGTNAKSLVEHGDIVSLSIYANELKQQGVNVIHGAIKEVSLVLAGANKGARIEEVIAHNEEMKNEAVIYTGDFISLSHSELDNDDIDETKEQKTEVKEKTVAEIIEGMSEEEKNVLYALVGQAATEKDESEELKETEELEESEESEESEEIDKKENKKKDQKDQGGNKQMKHNAFDAKGTSDSDNTLIHDGMAKILEDGKKIGSLRESYLEHAASYGIENIDYLFPEATNLNNPPQFIQREMGWVQKVMNAVHHSPFSRIKSTFADITEEDARAKGYTKGNLKKEEVFSLLKRTTTPTTIYKKQKLDRDDVIDITDFDVVAWLKSEMRLMLDEEIARASLIGDGRLSSSDDKINETNIRPIWTDAELYTIKARVQVTAEASEDVKAKAFIRTVIKSRKEYKGSGNPTLYTTEDMLTDCLLLEDTNGRVIYDSVEKLATALRVKEIVAVPPMENLKREVTENSTAKELGLLGIIVNLIDYNIGADKGGAVNMFDDFDIDYNQQKYLIETRCSGALTKPYSAITVELDVVTSSGQG